MRDRYCLVHYHELGLKRRNRTDFERRLRDNLDAALVSLPVGRTDRIAGRLLVPVLSDSHVRTVAERISHVPGVARVSLVRRTDRELPSILAVCAETLAEAGSFESFRVTARRSNTDFPIPSMELAAVVGSHLCAAFPSVVVNLRKPDVTINVEVVQAFTYVYAESVPGVGGLPVGSDSKVVALLSAGMDSPVATWRIVRRGAVAVGVHFSGVPYTSDHSESLVHRIATVLESAGGIGRIYYVSFGEVQKRISLEVPPDLRVIFYRRMMFAVCEAIAKVERAKALVTGESLGQVASQTLDNIRAIDDATDLPVLRPLIGHDKNEIISEAEWLQTMDISMEDSDDCCTLFMPRNPETHASLRVVREIWDGLAVDEMVEQLISRLRWREYHCPSYRPPARWPRAMDDR